MPRFLIHHAGEGSRVFELASGHPLSIGRAKSSSLVLDNSSVSRLHAVVRSTPDGGWEIVDHDSSNGVKVNGTSVKEAVLRPNDEVVIGEYRMRFFEDGAARNVVTYGTAQLPAVSRECSRSPRIRHRFCRFSLLATSLRRTRNARRLSKNASVRSNMKIVF